MSYINEPLDAKSEKELAKIRSTIKLALDYERRFFRSSSVRKLGAELRTVEHEMRKRFHQERKADQ